jgi:hypothetical protein
VNRLDADADKDVVRALLQAQDLAVRMHLELEQAQDRAAMLQASLEQVQHSISFKLGAALVASLRSWRGLVALPGALLRLMGAQGKRALQLPPSNSSALPRWAEFDLSGLIRAGTGMPETLAQLRVAAVLDQFTERCFAPDCQLVNLPDDGFEALLDTFAPHLLLVESAWRGREGVWRNQFSPPSSRLRYLLDCCKRRGIPTVFWNKEDPVHFRYFLPAAALFDHVLTTDANCVPEYRETLGHSRVGVLRFACQPAMHHPVQSQERERGACFAGSWYRAYPERCQAFERLIAAVQRVMPVVIYDRNHQRNDPSFAYPERYRPLIRAGVPYEQIPQVYKAYTHAITVNSVQESPTMLARRVYELLACNTMVISNPTRSLADVFGDVVVGANVQEDIERVLRLLEVDRVEFDRRRLRGLRTVLKNDTASQRLSEVCAMAMGLPLSPAAAKLVVVGIARTSEEANSLLASYSRQSWQYRQMCLVLEEGARGFLGGNKVADVRVMNGDAPLPDDLRGQDTWCALFRPEDHYGPRYLEDLALAVLYGPDQDRIGKSQRFSWRDGRCEEHRSALSYRIDAPLSPRAMIVRASLIGGERGLAELDERIAPAAGQDITGLVIDGFEYCKYGAGKDVGRVDV